MTYVVVATGNHFWLDAALGALVAALAFGAASGPLRPERWSFQGARTRPAPSGPGPGRGRARVTMPEVAAPARGGAARARRRGPLSAVRNRLIESRLTPNAISITGFVFNVAAAVLVWQRSSSSPASPSSSAR